MNRSPSSLHSEIGTYPNPLGSKIEEVTYAITRKFSISVFRIAFVAGLARAPPKVPGKKTAGTLADSERVTSSECRIDY